MTGILDANKIQLDQAIADLTAELNKDPVSEVDVCFAWSYCIRMHRIYETTANKLLEDYNKHGKTTELEDLTDISAAYIKAIMKMEFLKNSKLTPAASTSASGSSAGGDSSLKLLLPNRQLPQFTGEVRDWLAFWASFKEVDGDTKLSETDKFHYLVQSTKDGSPARKLVQSFPFSSANYTPALTALKERFGRHNVLIKVYVRDLLQLVVEASMGKQIEFSDLVTIITSQVRNLESLGVTQDKCAQVLYPVVESCLPQEVLQAWQRHATYKEELNALITFLQSEVNNYTERNLAHFQLRCAGNEKSGAKTPQKKNKEEVSTISSFMNGDGRKDPKPKEKENCAFCDKPHFTRDCRKALGMSLSSKQALLKEKNCCFSCLRKGNHKANDCKFKVGRCYICEKSHHPLLCPNLDAAREKTPSTSHQESTSSGNSPSSSGTHTRPGEPGRDNNLCNSVHVNEVPLQTMLVTIEGDTKKKIVRLAMDSGSSRTYCSEATAAQLGLQKVGEEKVVHELFGGLQTKPMKHNLVKTSISDIKGENKLDFVIQTSPLIANNVRPPPPGPWIERFQQKGITFTDLKSQPNAPIEILIGNDKLGKILTGRLEKLDSNEDGLVAMETLWGWVLLGEAPHCSSNDHMLLNMNRNPIAALWELEAIGITDPVESQTRKELEEATQQHFNKTVSQLTNGRYEVHLPWMVGAKAQLPTHKYAAVRRLKSTTLDLKVKGYLEKYHKLFQQWEDEKMIEVVPPEELDNPCHYLPHRAVVKLSSETTPIRPVFDGSAKQRGTLSLNDCLDKGPNMLELIPPILMRFRLRKIGVTADIRKAFQQISVAPADRDYLRFVWWDDLSCKREKVYRHTRVVFGVTCSPYLLAAVLHHHLNKSNDPDVAVAKQLLQSVYVDNTILSVDTLEEARELQRIAVSLLLPAQFDLRCWEFGPTLEEKAMSVLGLKWNLKEDVLGLDVKNINLLKNEAPTLRRLLSLVHSIYDPLGFAVPFTIVGKLLLRRSYEEKGGMDKVLSPPVTNDISKWADQISDLSDLQVPRHVQYAEAATYSLHVFSDASSQAVAGAVYLRKETESTAAVFLLLAKSRVAPQKKATIPRLELVSSVVAARLYYSVMETLGFPNLPSYFWSDSSTAIAWIGGPGPWGVFVTNTVNKIKTITKENPWRHVPGKMNIADLPSRGCSAKKLLESKWWEGPEWLRQPSISWPASTEEYDPELVDKERRKTVVTAFTTTQDHPMMKFLPYDYPWILKYLAYWLKLKKNLQENVVKRKQENLQQPIWKNNEEKKISLTAEEINQAEKHLVLFIQQPLRDDPDRLRKLDVFSDEFGVIRLLTRLTLYDEEDFACPMILPDKDDFVKQLVIWEHEQNCHVGALTLLGILREKFWILNGKRTVRGIITKCWICKRYTTRRIAVPEGPLPNSRSKLGAPYETTGLDAAGPLFLKGGEKCWIILYTCAIYRAIHLELVKTLSTDGFIEALRRFVARCGRPNIIYCDNARGFVAANKVFRRINWEKVLEVLPFRGLDGALFLLLHPGGVDGGRGLSG